jgi:DnaK suppressor protein
MTLTAAQGRELARRLDALAKEARDDIRAALQQSGDAKYAELAGTVHDLGDEAVANELIELDDARIERRVHELREIEPARRRLADASIDRCAECGGDIGYARLRAYPVAVRCIACQGQHEKTYAHEGTPRL